MQPAKLGGAMPEARCKKIPHCGIFSAGTSFDREQSGSKLMLT
jgi:hypothetical protein